MTKTVKGTPRKRRPFTTMLELNIELLNKKRKKTPSTPKPAPKRKPRRRQKA